MNDQEKQKQIDAIAEQFKADSKAARARQYAKPVDEKLRPLKKRLKSIDVERDYSGEGSPYWDFMAEIQDLRNKELKIQEDVIANPDVLAEEDAIHHRPLTSEGEVQMEAVHQTMAELTPRQRSIIQLALEGVWVETEDETGEVFGVRLHTEQAIADELGIAQETVRDSIAGIRTKIRRRYEKLKAERK